MATPRLEVRTPQALQDLIRKAAEANGRSFAEEVNATLGERYMGEEAPAQVAPRAAKAPKPQVAPAQVPGVTTGAQLSERGVSMSAAMRNAGIAEYDPSAKRPQYVKGSAGAGKGRR